MGAARGAQVNLEHPLLKSLHKVKAQDEAVAKMVRPSPDIRDVTKLLTFGVFPGQ